MINHDKITCDMKHYRQATCSSVEMLKVYMLICRNAEGVLSKRKVGKPALEYSMLWCRSLGHQQCS